MTSSPALEGIRPVSRALFSYDARDRSLVARSGQTLAFSRASIGMAADSKGLLYQAVHSAPRWHSFLGASGLVDERGILLEAQKTNIILRSEELGDAAWTKTGVTIGTNEIRAPDGRLAADQLEETTANSTHGVDQTVTITAGNYLAISVFVRPAERTRFYLRASNGGDRLDARFDLAAQTATNFSVGNATFVAAWVDDSWRDPDGNIWYRLVLIGRVNAGSTSIRIDGLMDNGSTNTYAGTTGSGLYVWGWQVEQGSSAGALATSYIPTAGATVTRAADSLTTQGLWEPQDMTWYVRIGREAWMDAAGTLSHAPTVVSWSDVDPAFAIYFLAATRNIRAHVRGLSLTQVASPAIPAGNVIEACAQYIDVRTDAKVRMDVGSGFGATSAPAGPITGVGSTDLWLGNMADAGVSGAGPLCAPLARVLIMPGALTMAQMRSLY